MDPTHAPTKATTPAPKPKTCTGNETGDVIGSVSAHLGLAAAGIISPPGVQCVTGAADLALTVGEETGIVCGGSLKTESPVWRGVNIGLASAGAAISCVPIVGNIFNVGRTAVEGVELGVRAFGGWFTSLFRPRIAAVKAVSTGVELAERTAASTAHAAETIAKTAAKAALTPGRITTAAVSTGGRAGERVVQTLAKVSNVEEKIAREVVKEAVTPVGLPARVTRVAAEEAVRGAEEAGVQLAAKDTARAVPHAVVEPPLRLPPPRPPRPPVGVAMSTAMRAHLVAEIGSLTGQVIAPGLGVTDVTAKAETEEKPPIAFFPAIAGMVTAYLLARRYNFF
jgi:hypothetical protein